MVFYQIHILFYYSPYLLVFLAISCFKMKYLFPFLFLILLISYSCDSKKTNANESKNDSIALNSKRITNSITETLTPSAKKDFENWEEYQDVDEFITAYYSISISEALMGAENLAGLVKLMKDTIRVPAIDKLNVIARFNVLHNETLRLADMANIPSISDEEVSEEVSQILDVYASVNSKINTIYKAQDLQEALEVDTEEPIDLDEEIESVKLSSGITKSPAKTKQ